MCLSAPSPRALNSVWHSRTQICAMPSWSVLRPLAVLLFRQLPKLRARAWPPAWPVQHMWAVLVPEENSAAELSLLLPTSSGYFLPCSAGLWELQSQQRQLPQSEIRSRAHSTHFVLPRVINPDIINLGHECPLFAGRWQREPNKTLVTNSNYPDCCTNPV